MVLPAYLPSIIYYTLYVCVYACMQSGNESSSRLNLCGSDPMMMKLVAYVVYVGVCKYCIPSADMYIRPIWGMWPVIISSPVRVRKAIGHISMLRRCCYSVATLLAYGQIAVTARSPSTTTHKTVIDR